MDTFAFFYLLHLDAVRLRTPWSKPSGPQLVVRLELRLKRPHAKRLP
jgi:hypothetical protein